MLDKTAQNLSNLEQFGNQFLGVNAFGVGDTMRLS